MDKKILGRAKSKLGRISREPVFTLKAKYSKALR
jgi:hypothetical protein